MEAARKIPNNFQLIIMAVTRLSIIILDILQILPQILYSSQSLLVWWLIFTKIYCAIELYLGMWLPIKNCISQVTLRVIWQSSHQWNIIASDVSHSQASALQYWPYAFHFFSPLNWNTDKLITSFDHIDEDNYIQNCWATI